MAYKVSKLIQQEEQNKKNNNQYLVVAGKGHVSHYLGVPEYYHRLTSTNNNATTTVNTTTNNQRDEDDELLICSQMMYEIDDLYDDEDERKDDDSELEKLILQTELIQNSMKLQDIVAPITTNDTAVNEKEQHSFQHAVADILYIYDEEDWDDDDEDDDSNSNDDEDERIKKETREAYDKVGETASTRGSVRKARAILTHLGYTPEEQSIIGEDDMFNYQGVGNPFRLAKIQSGEKVLDIGSGLGIDSFLAHYYSRCSNSSDNNKNNEGRVVGIDISPKEVRHAQKRAVARGTPSSLSFHRGDMEDLFPTIDKNYFDVVISNGAFCLAPNKRKAFQTVYDALKPGGRMTICTTTVRMDLEKETHWPICMKMFAHLGSLKALCEDIGFTDVDINMDDPDMEFELPIEEEDDDDNEEGSSNDDDDTSSSSSEGEEEKEEPARTKIHVGSEEFRHLQNYNMNELCARVVVCGTK